MMMPGGTRRRGVLAAWRQNDDSGEVYGIFLRVSAVPYAEIMSHAAAVLHLRASLSCAGPCQLVIVVCQRIDLNNRNARG